MPLDLNAIERLVRLKLNQGPGLMLDSWEPKPSAQPAPASSWVCSRLWRRVL